MEARARRGRPPARREPLAVPPARHLRRVDRPLPRRLRGGRTARCPSTACAGSSTTPRRSRSATSSASRRSAAASPSSTGWPSRASTSSTATARRRPSARRPSRACSTRAFPVGAGTDATRVASYNPWVSLYWLVTRQDGRRHRALSARRTGSTGWRRCGSTPWAAPGSPARRSKKGAIVPGQLADLAVLSADYFSVPEEEIKGIESVLTMVGGKVVYGRVASSRWRRRLRAPARAGRPAGRTAATARRPARRRALASPALHATAAPHVAARSRRVLGQHRLRVLRLLRFVALAALTFSAAPLTAHAQTLAASGEASRPPAYQKLRYDEDYAYLADPSRRSDLWDPPQVHPAQRCAVTRTSRWAAKGAGATSATTTTSGTPGLARRGRLSAPALSALRRPARLGVVSRLRPASEQPRGVACGRTPAHRPRPPRPPSAVWRPAPPARSGR